MTYFLLREREYIRKEFVPIRLYEVTTIDLSLALETPKNRWRVLLPLGSFEQYGPISLLRQPRGRVDLQASFRIEAVVFVGSQK
jgi:hypothetical protein